MGDRLVTIAQFANYIEAELAKQQLADFGIEAVVTGANTANMYAGFPVVGLPELQVLESRANEALEILESNEGQEYELKEELEDEEEQ
jgi:Putative prokaryotic signal transducing protein